MSTEYGAGDQGVLDAIKQRLENTKKLGNTSLASFSVSVEETQSKGIAIITPEDAQADSAIGSYKETVVDALDSKLGTNAGGLLNSISSKVSETVDRIKGDDASILDEVGNAVDKYKNDPKGYQKDILNGVANSIFSSGTGGESTIGSTLKELGMRNFGSGKGGFKDNLVDNINSIFKLTTGNNNSTLLLSTPYGDNPVSLQLSNLLLKGGGDALLSVVGNYVGVDIENLIQKNAIVTSLLGKVIDLGVQELIDPLLSKFVFGEDRDKALMWGVPNAILTGDIRMIDKIIKALSNDQARNNLYKRYPTAVADILRSFSFKYNDKPEQYPDLRKLMLSLFVKFGGVNWMYHPDYVKEKYVNLSYTYISRDATTLLMEEEKVVPMIQCSGLFALTDAKSVFLQHFNQTPEVDY